MSRLFDSSRGGAVFSLPFLRQGDNRQDGSPASNDRTRLEAGQCLRLTTGACSVTGNYRQLNEDRCYGDPAAGVLLVVDGMGGHRGGADASRLIAETAPAVLAGSRAAEQSPGASDGDNDRVADESLRQAIEQAILAARQEIVRFAASRPGYENMGATVVMAVVKGEKLFLASIGDCRAYRLHRGELSLLTTDQTFVQSMIDAGQLSPEEAKFHPWRHVVLNALGVRLLEEPIHIKAIPLSPGDRLLLTSDGLTDVLDDAAIKQLLKENESPQAAAEALTQAALDCDAKDNVSCIVADLVCEDRPKPLAAN